MIHRTKFIMDYWEKEKNFLINFYIVKKLKKSKNSIKKLGSIEPEHKEFICKAYALKCFLNFNIKFSIWRIKLLGNQDCDEYHEEIAARTAMHDKLKGWIFAGTDSVVEDGAVIASLKETKNENPKTGLSPTASLANARFDNFTGACKQMKEDFEIYELNK